MLFEEARVEKEMLFSHLYVLDKLKQRDHVFVGSLIKCLINMFKNTYKQRISKQLEEFMYIELCILLLIIFF